MPKDHRQVNSDCLQYCAKVMQTKFDQFREYSTKISEICLERLFDNILGVLLFEQPRYFVALCDSSSGISQHFTIVQAKFCGTP